MGGKTEAKEANCKEQMDHVRSECRCLLCTGDTVEPPVAHKEEGSLLIKIKEPICFIISESSSAR